MACLYEGHHGPVTIHSYSAGGVFRECARKYQLLKIEGWREREQRASARFGEAFESAIAHFYKQGCKPHTAVEGFDQKWKTFKNVPDLVYKDKEGDWAAMGRLGQQMAALYEVKAPVFGFTRPQFQQNYRKRVFEGGGELGNLEFTAWVDMLCEIEGKPFVIDIKTSSVACPDHLMLDQQLRTYAWLTGVPNVGFLWGQKCGMTYKKGDHITTLAGPPDFPSGTAGIVLYGEADHAVVLAP